MPLLEQITKDIMSALKNKERCLDILRMLKAGLVSAQIEKRTKVKDLNAALSDEEILEVIRKQAKQLKDALADFTKAGRRDLIEKTEAEIKTLEAYLPAGLSDEELQQLVETAVQELVASGPGDMGKVMGAVMKRAGGADGNKVRNLVAKILGEK